MMSPIFGGSSTPPPLLSVIVGSSCDPSFGIPNVMSAVQSPGAMRFTFTAFTGMGIGVFIECEQGGGAKRRAWLLVYSVLPAAAGTP